MQHQEQMEKVLISHKEELEKLRRENDGRTSLNSTETCSLLVENYKKIRDQNCDLILELSEGKTLSVHKAILMGKLIDFHPP